MLDQAPARLVGEYHRSRLVIGCAANEAGSGERVAVGLAPQPGDRHDSAFDHEPMHDPDRGLAVDVQPRGDVVADQWVDLQLALVRLLVAALMVVYIVTAGEIAVIGKGSETAMGQGHSWKAF